MPTRVGQEPRRRRSTQACSDIAVPGASVAWLSRMQLQEMGGLARDLFDLELVPSAANPAYDTL